MLFHGSNVEIKDGFLKPNISFDYKPLVYATDNYWYALVRCGKFDIKDISIREEYIDPNHPYTLVELRENAFRDIFDTSGYIYMIDNFCFTERNGEYISENSVPIHGTKHIENVWASMQEGIYNGAYNLVNYQDCNKYFKSIGCDKEAYLKRREDRIRKIKELKGEVNG